MKLTPLLCLQMAGALVVVSAIVGALILALIALIAYVADVDLKMIAWRSVWVMYAIISALAFVAFGLAWADRIMAQRAKASI